MRIDPGFAAHLLEKARKHGADLAEAYLKSSTSLSAEVRGQEPEAVESSSEFGYSLRIIRNGRLGFSFSRKKEDADVVVESALEASRWVEEDRDLDFAEPLEHTPLRLFDESVASMNRDGAIARALMIEGGAVKDDRRIRKTRKATASFSKRDVLIMNSKGMEKTYSSTSCTGQITVVAEENGDRQTGWDFDGSRFLGDVSFADVGRRAAQQALQLLGAQRIGGTQAPVILENAVATEFLGIFASLLSSEAVQKGRSLLAGRLHQEVVSPLLSIVDDGSVERKLGSRPFDDEGVPTSRKFLIKDGTLKAYMYSLATARKEGVQSSGNAVKGGISALPAVGPLNLSIVVAPSHVHRGSLIPLLKKGLYVTDAMGIHTANPVSGEFSIGVSGLWIEGGVARHAVKEAVISGNILDFFRRTEAAADDFRYYGNVGAPSLLMGDTDISA